MLTYSNELDAFCDNPKYFTILETIVAYLIFACPLTG